MRAFYSLSLANLALAAYKEKIYPDTPAGDYGPVIKSKTGSISAFDENGTHKRPIWTARERYCESGPVYCRMKVYWTRIYGYNEGWKDGSFQQLKRDTEPFNVEFTMDYYDNDFVRIKTHFTSRDAELDKRKCLSVGPSDFGYGMDNEESRGFWSLITTDCDEELLSQYFKINEVESGAFTLNHAADTDFSLLLDDWGDFFHRAGLADWEKEKERWFIMDDLPTEEEADPLKGHKVEPGHSGGTIVDGVWFPPGFDFARYGGVTGNKDSDKDAKKNKQPTIKKDKTPEKEPSAEMKAMFEMPEMKKIFEDASKDLGKNVANYYKTGEGKLEACEKIKGLNSSLDLISWDEMFLQDAVDKYAVIYYEFVQDALENGFGFNDDDVKEVFAEGKLIKKILSKNIKNHAGLKYKIFPYEDERFMWEDKIENQFLESLPQLFKKGKLQYLKDSEDSIYFDPSDYGMDFSSI